MGIEPGTFCCSATEPQPLAKWLWNLSEKLPSLRYKVEQKNPFLPHQIRVEKKPLGFYDLPSNGDFKNKLFSGRAVMFAVGTPVALMYQLKRLAWGGTFSRKGGDVTHTPRSWVQLCWRICWVRCCLRFRHTNILYRHITYCNKLGGLFVCKKIWCMLEESGGR